MSLHSILGDAVHAYKYFVIGRKNPAPPSSSGAAARRHTSEIWLPPVRKATAVRRRGLSLLDKKV